MPKAHHTPVTVVAALSVALSGAAACSDGSTSGNDGLWAANPDRLGPISANTRFDQASLTDALDGYTVTASQGSSEGMTYLIYEARRDGASETELVIDGDGDQVLAVTIKRAGLVQTPADIGMTAGAADLDLDNCFAGLEERSGDVVCQDPRPTGLTYWIHVDHAGPDGELPPAQTVNAGTIYEIQWVPIPG